MTKLKSLDELIKYAEDATKDEYPYEVVDDDLALTLEALKLLRASLVESRTVKVDTDDGEVSVEPCPRCRYPADCEVDEVFPPHSDLLEFVASVSGGDDALARRAQEILRTSPVEPGGDCWRPPITAPADCDCLFSLRPIAKDDPYFVDTSGNPILGKGEPRVILSRYGRWSSLEVMTGWMPLPSPVNRT